MIDVSSLASSAHIADCRCLPVLYRVSGWRRLLAEDDADPKDHDVLMIDVSFVGSSG
jgi:hypothetical protein